MIDPISCVEENYFLRVKLRFNLFELIMQQDNFVTTAKYFSGILDFFATAIEAGLIPDPSFNEGNWFLNLGYYMEQNEPKFFTSRFAKPIAPKLQIRQLCRELMLFMKKIFRPSENCMEIVDKD